MKCMDEVMVADLPMVNGTDSEEESKTTFGIECGGADVENPAFQVHIQIIESSP